MGFRKGGKEPLRDVVLRAAWRFAFAMAFAAVSAMTLPVPCLAAQTGQSPEAQPGQILGTVMDVNESPVAGAKVVLAGRRIERLETDGLVRWRVCS